MPYTRFGLSGIAFDGVGGLEIYTVERSVITFAYDPATRVASLDIQLIGTRQTDNGPASVATDLGTYSGVTMVDAATETFGGTMLGRDRNSVFAPYGAGSSTRRGARSRSASR
jgi:hypothetical protein